MDGTILIIDDIATNRIVLKAKLTEARYHPIVAPSAMDGLFAARKEAPDLILFHLMMPDAIGLDVLRALRNDPATRDIPVIVLSSSERMEDRLAPLEAGADDLFIKPYDDALLMARLRNLLRSRQDLTDLTEGQASTMFGLADGAVEFGHPGVVAVLTERPQTAVQLRRDLASHIRDTILICGQTVLHDQSEPGFPMADIYLIDSGVADADRDLHLLSDLRSRAATRHAGICLMTEPAQGAHRIMAYDLGASTILTTDMPVAEMALRLRTVLRRKRRSDLRREQVQDGLRLAMIDPLTGLFNRRYAAARLTAMAERAVQDGLSLIVMVADIDRFKAVNDRYGHAVGDDVLIEVGTRLGAVLRPEDLLARIGGEEFLIAMCSSKPDEAQTIARRLCSTIEQGPFPLATGDSLSVTISIGVALSDTPSEQGSEESMIDRVAMMIDRADQALLASKRAGRNKVTLGQSAA